jgi:hypothetical protein
MVYHPSPKEKYHGSTLILIYTKLPYVGINFHIFKSIFYFARVFIIIDISNTMNIFGYMTMIGINFQEIFIILPFYFWCFVHWERRKTSFNLKAKLMMSSCLNRFFFFFQQILGFLDEIFCTFTEINQIFSLLINCLWCTIPPQRRNATNVTA